MRIRVSGVPARFCANTGGTLLGTTASGQFYEVFLIVVFVVESPMHKHRTYDA